MNHSDEPGTWPKPSACRSWLFARRDCSENLGSRCLDELQRFRQGLLVAIPELNVRSGCVGSVQANGVRHDESNRFRFGLANGASRLVATFRAMHQLVAQLVDQYSR